LVAALADSDVSAVQQALSAARVFVPVAAQLVSADATGADKQSDMALLLLDGSSGQALPVFSSVETLAAWDDGRTVGARPVAVAGSDALAHASAEALAAVVVDVAGPHPAVLEVASSGTYRPGSWYARRRLIRALRRSGAAEAYLLEVGDGRPALGLVLSAEVPVAVVVERVSAALDRPIDVALLDEEQRAAVLAAGSISVV
jgi:hypothetical protein